MKNPTMLYKSPGPHDIHGGKFDTLVVDADDVDGALADGWHLTTPNALAASKAKADAPDGDAPPTREELEAKAKELGIEFDGRTGNKSLATKIAAALAV